MTENNDSCKIWTRFESKRKDGSVIKLRVEDIPDDRLDDLLDFHVKVFAREEAFCKAAGIPDSQEALDECRSIIGLFLKESKWHKTFCCVDDDSDTTKQILGISMMSLTKRNETGSNVMSKLELKTKEVKQMFQILPMLSQFGGTKSLDYDTYYEGRGVMVHPDYRGLGIANELIKVRKMICVEHGVPMTCAWMTAVGTQKAAEKHNWKTLVDVPLEELDNLTGLTFEKITQTYKLIYTTIN